MIPPPLAPFHSLTPNLSTFKFDLQLTPEQLQGIKDALKAEVMQDKVTSGDQDHWAWQVATRHTHTLTPR